MLSLHGITNQQQALLVGRVIYVKLDLANRLVTLGEAHSGFAADSVVGKSFRHQKDGGTPGTEHFDDATMVTDSPDGGVSKTGHFTYRRTGLNTARLVLHLGGTITVKLSFISTTGGTFTAQRVAPDGTVKNGNGTFTLN